MKTSERSPEPNHGEFDAAGAGYDALTLSIVIPAFNETRRLGRTLERIRRYAEQVEARWEVIVVDDGSSDGTADLARLFDPGCLRLHVLVSPKNMGKGYSVREGALAATGAMILMCDADLSTPIEDVEKLQPWIERGYDLVIGSRHLPQSVLDPPQGFSRRIMDAVFRRVRRTVMLADLHDTQCGFKCFKRLVARRLFPLLTVHGFGFDCQVLYLARTLGYRIKEVPIRWSDDRDSRVRPLRDAARMLLDLFVIKRRPAVEPPHVRAHVHAANHRAEVLASEICGCFSCQSIFSPDRVEAWFRGPDDDRATACCPECGADSVIGSHCGYPITNEFLERMRRHWFGSRGG